MPLKLEHIVFLTQNLNPFRLYLKNECVSKVCIVMIPVLMSNYALCCNADKCNFPIHNLLYL